MGIINNIMRWFGMVFSNKAVEEFDVRAIASTQMDQFVDRCVRIYKGRPDWIDDENGVKTIKFAKTLCSETARLATMAINITVDGSSRADWLQEQLDRVYFSLRHWVEFGTAFGTIILKPNGKDIDVLTPDKFMITDQSNGEITGCVFVDNETSHDGKKFYTRLEYHRFIQNDAGERIYMITNKTYISDVKKDIGKPIAIEDTPWNGLQEEVGVLGIDKPLFGVFRTPAANDIDIDSPMGLPIFSEALEELKDLDIAYSRNSGEIFDSDRIVLLDSDRLMASGGRVASGANGFEHAREQMKLPKYVRNVMGDGASTFYQEINPALNTEERLKGIDALLSLIGFKCGFSNGYFVFDQKTGMVTATQVEADDRRTIQYIKDVRDKIEACIDGLLYALDKFADLYNLAPYGEYETTYDFGDITYNREEDRVRWWSYVIQGKVPAWKFFVKFEGMSEDDAKEMVGEAEGQAPKFFEEE